MQQNKFIAHKRESDGVEQILWDHLIETASYSKEFAGKIGLGKYGEILGILHDLGKASKEFNNYILSAYGILKPGDDAYVDFVALKGKIDHSTAGAQYLYKNFINKLEINQKTMLVIQILNLVIISHHTGLLDIVSPDGTDKFDERMNKQEDKTHFYEAVENLDDKIKNCLNKILKNDFIDGMFNRIKDIRDSLDSQKTFRFKTGLLVRYLYSCLIDADRLNTAEFEDPLQKKIRNHSFYETWNDLIERFEKHISEFACNNRIDEIRKEISQKCYEFSNRDHGIFKLSVPTGGGKTLASMRFALHHAERNKMSRIIYIIPYTSIIDQNAQVMREIFEEKIAENEYSCNIVLEHHSNLTPNEENKKQKLLSENWDAPIVFTTMVQFLETLFGYGTRSARHMHQLANAVIIFDEIQTLPIRCVCMFNVAIRFLVNFCNSTVILCTATQPLLDKLEVIDNYCGHRGFRFFNLPVPEQHEIMGEKKDTLFKDLKRVEIIDLTGSKEIWDDNKIGQFVLKQLEETESVLIVVNKKSSARNLFRKIKTIKEKDKIGIALFHLSTSMCSQHRLDTLNEIMVRLEKRLPTICVSTQLIEAGVNVDFGCVIRYLAGLDSIVQSAGRCNRNGHRITGKVYIIKPSHETEEINKNLKDIQKGIEICADTLEIYQKDPQKFDNDLSGIKVMNDYYRRYFFERREEMMYPLDSNSEIGRHDSLVELLSENSLSFRNFKEKYPGKLPYKYLFQSFGTATTIFKSIESSGRGVIVPYGEGKEIIKNLCGEIDLVQQKRELKKAQRYSVNLYEYEFKKFRDELKIIKEVRQESGIYYLDEQYYSMYFGACEEIVTEMEELILS
ncbi:MAG: CRISPR-associated helicase Cas3' [Clostridia bacterium]|nr:CRISPR-associated helicase Cas3' [Clostridia bacterium]